MYLRLDQIPTLHTRSARIEARYWNDIRLAVIRANGTLRLPLAGLRGMDMILGRRAWICVDRTFYDLPVLAWAEFGSAARTALHHAVECQLHFYHIHADFITTTVLNATLNAIKARKARP
jgi:hypothetical protein